MTRLAAFASLAFVAYAHAHLVAWTQGMYCKNGTVPGVDNVNNDAPITPLYQLKYSDYWFHGVNGCNNFPPDEGEYLELPAGGSFTAEIADNRAATTLSFNGAKTSDWPDGASHPDGYSITNTGGAALSDVGCLQEPNLHTQNETMAAGTAFAISYNSDMSQVNLNNLVVFSVRYNTPYKRVVQYDVPADLPACPDGGCTCAWMWIPNGCGLANMYMAGYKCMVTNATSTVPVATPQAPVWCEDDQSQCVKGAKQVMIWHQAEGNNVDVSGLDDAGNWKSPGYNWKMGFADGAQNDIFQNSNTGSSKRDEPIEPPKRHSRRGHKMH